MARHARWSNTISSRLGFDLYSGNEKETHSRPVKTGGIQSEESKEAKAEPENSECFELQKEDNEPSESSFSASIPSCLDANGAKPPRSKKDSLRNKIKNKVRKVLKSDTEVNVEKVDSGGRHEADSKFVSDWMLKMDEVRDAIRSKTDNLETKEVTETSFDELDFNVDDESEIVRTSKEIISKLSENSLRQFSELLPSKQQISVLEDVEENSDGPSDGSDSFFPRKVDAWFPGKTKKRTKKKVKKAKSYYLENDGDNEEFQTIRMAIKIDEPEAIPQPPRAKAAKKLKKKKSRTENRVKHEFTTSVSASNKRNTYANLQSMPQPVPKKSTIPIEVLRPDILLSWKSETYSINKRDKQEFY